MSCALDMLIHLAEAAFPALDRRTRKRGAKWTMQALLFNGGDGSIMLAHAVTALMVRANGRLSDEEPAENVVDVSCHRRLQEAVASFYPLPRHSTDLIADCDLEYRVMDTHKPREAVLEDPSAGNEYSQALLRGENPDDDPALVAMQREYARDFFIDRATFGVIRQTLDRRDRVLLRDKLVRFPRVEDPKQASELRKRNLAAWIEGLRPYHEYARVDSG